MSSEKEAAFGLPTSAKSEVPCWEQMLEYEWNAKSQNCEGDAQVYWTMFPPIFNNAERTNKRVHWITILRNRSY